MATTPIGTPFGNTPPSPLVTTVSPTSTSSSVETIAIVRLPSAEPSTLPRAREDCTTAGMAESSSVSSRTTEDAVPHSTIWPITPVEEHTGIPTARPAEEPFEIVIVELHESAEPEMTVAAVLSSS